MAQLFFKYGAMNAGKSIDLLKTAHNYEEQGKNVVILTSALDTRAEVGNIPVICFGLKTDFQGKLFEGSKALF